MTATKLPRIAAILGDPAGIGPELMAHLLGKTDALKNSQLLLITHPALWQRAQRIAGVQIALETVQSIDQLTQSKAWQSGQSVLLPCDASVPENQFPLGQSTAESGQHILACLRQGLAASQAGHAQALFFAPLNKYSLKLGGMGTNDELHWFARELKHEGAACEFNVLGKLWTSRVTSHIALKDVAASISSAGVIEAISLIDTAIKKSGVARPRIAVCGLNPHNGDNGSYGREEIEIIEPAVKMALQKGFDVAGPFAADTIFLKVQGSQNQAPQYDGIVTMYHDQGQIAMKLMGFWRGITVQGGLPIPIVTPAHGTAYDIAGQGKANPGAIMQAFELACKMAGSAA